MYSACIGMDLVVSAQSEVRWGRQFVCDAASRELFKTAKYKVYCMCVFIYRVCLHIYSFVCIASEIASEKKRTRPGKWKEKKKKKIKVCAFEPVLFLCDLVAVDALNESVCWCICMLALYSYCKTSRLIFQSACQCTCAVMHAVDNLLWVVCACPYVGGRGIAHTHIQPYMS